MNKRQRKKRLKKILDSLNRYGNDFLFLLFSTEYRYTPSKIQIAYWGNP